VKAPGRIVVLLLVIALGGTLVTLQSRESDTQFLAQQESLRPVSARALEELVATTHDPRPGRRGGLAQNVKCTRLGAGALRNPWTCVVRYPTAPQVLFHVVVAANRSIRGIGQDPSLAIRGCCVADGPE
jgi:hypothetical protein